jgi:hypothetical protein
MQGQEAETEAGVKSGRADAGAGGKGQDVSEKELMDIGKPVQFF